MRIVNILVSIVFLLFVATTLFFVYNFFYGKQVDLVVVPSIVNMDIYTAQENLKLMDLKLEIVSFTFSDKPSNVIVKQYPEAGMNVKKNSIVKVVVSSGSKEDKIPNLVNKNIKEISSDPFINLLIKKYNLALNIIYYPSLLIEDGKIILQIPKQDLPKNKKVNLLVSKKIDTSKYLQYQKLQDIIYTIDNDAILIELNKTDQTEDRIIQDIDIQKNGIIINSNLNYQQTPNMKITNVYIKTPYTDQLNVLEVILSDFLGTRTIMKQYYNGEFVSNLQVFYVGQANMVIKINEKKISSFELP